jgi:hypothetical protein
MPVQLSVDIASPLTVVPTNKVNSSLQVPATDRVKTLFKSESIAIVITETVTKSAEPGHIQRESLE